MNTRIRECLEADATACGEICFNAFKTFADSHNFPADFPSAEVATGFLSGLIAHPGFYGVVAESDGDIVGSNFLDERSSIAGVGPITVSSGIQNKTIGKALMMNVLDRAREKGFAGVRLLQTAYNNKSLSLYSKLGFNVQASFVVMQGAPVSQDIPGFIVRTAREEDLDACNAICMQVHGHDRSGELADAIKQGVARVVEHNHRIAGYSTGLAFFGHSVADSNDALKALIASASEFQGPGILVPTSNHELFRWCLENKLRVVHVMNLMSIGLYNHPTGSYLPSVLY
jgi:GNAT superfamily N-acetyltransferase